MDVSDAVFGVADNDALVRDVVLGYLSNQRQGTHKTKVRGEVSGGGIKPFRQKGTGRARQGDNREPQFRGGGTVHGPQPRSYRKRVPPRMKRQALCCVLSQRLRDERLNVLGGLEVGAPKTKAFAAMMSKVAPDSRKTLLVVAADDKNVLLSARNLKQVIVRTAADLHAVDVLHATRVILQEEAVSKLEERLS